MSMVTDYNDTIDLEEVALTLLRALRSVMSTEDQLRLSVDDIDTQQEPWMMLEIMERLAVKYSPTIPHEHKSIIKKEIGYTF